MGQDISNGCSCSCTRTEEVNFGSIGSRPATAGSGYETAGADWANGSRRLFPGGDHAAADDSLDLQAAAKHRVSGSNARISTASTQLASSCNSDCSPETEKRNSLGGKDKKFDFSKEKRISNTSSLGGTTSLASSTLETPFSARSGSIASDISEDNHSDVSDFGSECASEVTVRPRNARRGGICVASLEKHVFQPPSYDKDATTCDRLLEALEGCCIFKAMLSRSELQDLVSAMSLVHVEKGTRIVEQGAAGDALYVVLTGSVDCYLERSQEVQSSDEPKRRLSFITSRADGAIFGEVSVMCSLKRSLSVYARDDVTLARLESEVYQNLVVQEQFRKRERREECLRSVKLLEMLGDEEIAKLADALQVKMFEPGEVIIHQGDMGEDFFIVQSGECVATVRTFDDVQEVKRYSDGDLFGELALLKNAKRAATITATSHVEAMYINRHSFERMLGPLRNLMKSQYLHDPRKLIADFYRPGDHRGPLGSLLKQDLEPEPEIVGASSWFAVFRPCSKDAIAKMLGGFAVGKGLNVKGKSAKKNRLSGFVPFLQIMDNDHKDLIEEMPPQARVRVYYKTQAARDDALGRLIAIRNSMLGEKPFGSSHTILVKDFDKQQDAAVPVDQRLAVDDAYAPKTYGISMPATLLREAYIIQPDLSPLVGWETGRSSEPAFMNLNLDVVCNAQTDPQVVLVQHDEGNPLNPHGLLVAYAEATVKPVVSDFDAFLIASKGFEYNGLCSDQADLMNWSLDKAVEILHSPDEASWTSRWLDILKQEAENGFHPEIPKFGFGDPSSYRLIGDVIAQTAPCGAVRHGAECFNYYFPQELDETYLIVWEGFPDKPWDYKSEQELRRFLIDRVHEGFSFPLNPVWPVRDKGWHEVWEALKESPSAKRNLEAWFPPSSGVVERLDFIRNEFPGGFETCSRSQFFPTVAARADRPSLNREESVAAASVALNLMANRTSGKSPTTKRLREMKQTAYNMLLMVPRRRTSGRRSHGSGRGSQSAGTRTPSPRPDD